MWKQLREVIKITANDPERADYHFLARMLQISIVAFLAGGAFLSLSYFDLAWHFMAITIALNHLAKNLYQREHVVSVRRGVRAVRRPRGELPSKP
jgi:putative inorganic carbon (HCO3(-)) transporter